MPASLHHVDIAFLGSLLGSVTNGIVSRKSE